MALNFPEGNCAIPLTDSICVDDHVIKYHDYLVNQNQIEKNEKISKKICLEKIMKVLKVSTELNIWQHHDFRLFAGPNFCDKILKDKFIIEGPANSTALLDNNNIDETLALWAKHSQKLFNKKFYAIPFQMIDFNIQNTQLANLDMYDLIRDKYDCFGVVLNTDVSSGPGKHWLCLYGDLQHLGEKNDPYTIEFFNSSGNPAVDEITVWMEAQSHSMLKNHKKYVEIIRSAPRRLQHSKSECGMFSLIYIRSRLENKPHNWFYTAKIDDKDMIRYRKKIFRAK
jgi:hypothetical protein